MRLFTSRTLVLTTCLAVSAAGLLAGCSDDDDGGTTVAPLPKPDAGTTPVVDSGTKPPADAGGDAPAPATTLYQRLGERAGIAAAVDAIVLEEVKNADIASYFFANGSPPMAGHPSVDQIKACLVIQLASAAGGPFTYPPAPTETGGFQCRGMRESHAGLGIPGGTFDTFVTIAAGFLAGKISDADLAIVGNVLVGTKADVAQDTTRDAGPFIARDGGT